MNTHDDVQTVKERLGELRGIAVPTGAVWSSITDRAKAPTVEIGGPSGGRGWLAVAAVVLLLGAGAIVLAARGTTEPEPLRTAGPGTSTSAAPQTTELAGTVTVSQQPGKAVRICLAQLWSAGSECGGPEITGWDWNKVGPSTTDLVGGRSGVYTITGRLDGDTFAVSSAAPPASGSDPKAAQPPPCTAEVTDRSKTSQVEFDAMLAVAQALPGFAGEWYSRDDGAAPTPFDPSAGTETVAVAQGPDAARSQLEALWGGKICVVRVESSLRDLQNVQDSLDSFAEKRGIDMLGVAIDVPTNTVQVSVLVADPEAQAAADTEFGPGVVSIVGVFAES